MRIREILDLKGGTLYSISPDGLLADAVSLMVKHDVGSLVVLSGGAMVGLVTFREVLAALKAASFENRLLKQYIKNWPEPDPANSR